MEWVPKIRVSHSRPKKLKNSLNQKDFLWNCSFDGFKFFPTWKIDFWPFLKLQKMEFGQEKFHEINLFDFTNFFGPDFFKFSGPLCAIEVVTFKSHYSQWRLFCVQTEFTVIIVESVWKDKRPLLSTILGLAKLISKENWSLDVKNVPITFWG